jgi:hypothetical protein
MTTNHSTHDDAGQLQESEPSDHAFTVELLREYAGNCLMMAKAIELDKPYRNGFEVFDGSWLITRVMLESLETYDGGPPRRAFIELSAAVLRQLKQRRAEVIGDKGADDATD